MTSEIKIWSSIAFRSDVDSCSCRRGRSGSGWFSRVICTSFKGKRPHPNNITCPTVLTDVKTVPPANLPAVTVQGTTNMRGVGPDILLPMPV